MFTVNAGSLKVVVGNIRNLSVAPDKARSATVRAMGKVLERAVKQNVGLRDHSLADLAEMDHPYARRHGGIRIHRTGSKSLMHPEFRVHSQSGALLNSVKSGPTSGGGWSVGFDTAVAPHAVYVVMGTRVMLGRDVIWDSATAPLIQERMMKAVVDVLGRQLRSQASVRFER